MCGLFRPHEAVQTPSPLRLVLCVQMAVRSPFLLGLSHETLAARMQALSDALPNADVQSMAENYPSLLEVTFSHMLNSLDKLATMFLIHQHAFWTVRHELAAESSDFMQWLKIALCLVCWLFVLRR